MAARALQRHPPASRPRPPQVAPRLSQCSVSLALDLCSRVLAHLCPPLARHGFHSHHAHPVSQHFPDVAGCPDLRCCWLCAHVPARRTAHQGCATALRYATHLLALPIPHHVMFARTAMVGAGVLAVRSGKAGAALHPTPAPRCTVPEAGPTGDPPAPCTPHPASPPPDAQRRGAAGLGGGPKRAAALLPNPADLQPAAGLGVRGRRQAAPSLL